MSGDSRSAAGLDLVDAEARYRSMLQRWYPAAWVQVNGDVVVGTLLDLAERRGTATLTQRARGSLAAHGLVTRLSVALSREVRDRSASIGAGVVAGYSVVLAATSVVPTPWWGRSQPAHLASLLPFVSVWLLMAGTMFSGRRRLQVAVLVGAVVVTVATCGAWWTDRPFGFATGATSWWSMVGYFAPATIANVVLLGGASGLCLLGRPHVRLSAGSAATVAAAVALLLLITTGDLRLWEPDWLWMHNWTYSVPPAPFLGLLALDALVVAVLLARGRRSIATAMTVATVPWLLAWATELLLAPSIGIPT